VGGSKLGRLLQEGAGRGDACYMSHV
jgi:hypothetical protein